MAILRLTGIEYYVCISPDRSTKYFDWTDHPENKAQASEPSSEPAFSQGVSAKSVENLRTMPTNGKYFYADNEYVRHVDYSGALAREAHQRSTMAKKMK